ncbi:MAG TPA: PAS domain S-box protein [Aggregatilineales bacterium]|nr:PAS domain S-box protein [Aggregatilineales bacterium]
MTVNEFLTLIAQFFFAFLCLASILDFLRHRDNARRDIALMFISLGVPISIPPFFKLLGIQVPWLNAVTSAALIAHPYLMLRLLRFFRPIPRQIWLVSLVAMVASWAAIILFPMQLPVVVAVPIVVYILLIDAYAMLSFIRGALSTSGVVQQRLRFAAAGSGLFVLLLAALISSVVPVLKAPAIVFGLVAAILSALSFYLGFAPPRWLRRAWQLVELRSFLLQTRRQSKSEGLGVEDTFLQLCQAANRAVGGLAAAIIQWDESAGQWHVRRETGLPSLSGTLLNDLSVTQQGLREQRSKVIYASDSLNISDRRLLDMAGADTLLVVPITALERAWGILLVFLKYRSLFIEDDVSLLELLAQESTILLENYRLIGELRTYSEQLERRVEERTLAVRQSEKLYRTIANNFPNGSIILFDTNLRFMVADGTGLAQGGFSREQLEGKTIWDVFPQTYCDEVLEPLYRGALAGNLVPSEYPNGDRVSLVFGVPVRDEQGEIFAGLLISQDITERRKAEDEVRRLNAELEQRVVERTAQLLQSEAKFSTAFRASPAAISIATLQEGRWIEVNEALAQMTGYRSEDLLGHTSDELGLVDAVARAKILDAIHEKGTIRNVEIQVHTKSGELVDVLVSVEQIKLNGQACVLTIQYDITQLKRALREVERLNDDLEQRQVAVEAANKELEAFSYSVSHDLRAPLRGIDGYSRLLLRDHASQLDSEGQRKLQAVRTSIQQMGQLIDDLLAFSRLGRQPINKRSVEPAPLVRQILDELGAQQDSRRVEILLGDLPSCEADPSLLKQVYTNLLTNALKFTRDRETPQITAGSQIVNGKRTYFVKDNGVGFDMQFADKLFGVFQRLHSVEEFEGTGVGLAIVQRIVQRHGGRIWADSEVDKGATFYFTLDGANPND